MLIRTGTCSWKYDSWRGLVYPEMGKLNFLEEYSKHFNTVEIDQWFWSSFGKGSVKLPDENKVKEYNDSVDESFRFTIKVPNSITLTHFYQHGLKSVNRSNEINPDFMSNDLFNRFLDRIKPMQNKIATLMFQFEYLNKQKMSSQSELLDKFENFFNVCSRDIPIAIELRNPNFLTEQYFIFLRDHGISNVFTQGYYMPDIVPLYWRFRDYIEDRTVIRLIGPDRKKIEDKTNKDWSRIVSPKDDDLKNIADVLIELEKRGIKVFLNINNHYEGSAPLTIRKIEELLKINNR